MCHIGVPNALVPHRERAGMYTQRLGKIKNKPVSSQRYPIINLLLRKCSDGSLKIALRQSMMTLHFLWVPVRDEADAMLLDRALPAGAPNLLSIYERALGNMGALGVRSLAVSELRRHDAGGRRGACLASFGLQDSCASARIRLISAPPQRRSVRTLRRRSTDPWRSRRKWSWSLATGRDFDSIRSGIGN